MSELNWYWVYSPYLDAPEKQAESATKAGYTKVCFKSEADEVIAELKAEKEALLVKFRKFIDDHCATIVTATKAVENLSPNIQMDFYEEFIKEE